MRKQLGWFCCLLLCLCIWIMASYPDYAHAQDEEHIFNQTEMYRLLIEGYDWDDIVSASVLTYRYQIPVETILRLKPEDSSWKTFDESVKAMSETRDMAKGIKTPTSEVLALMRAGYSREEIVLIAYDAQQKKVELKDVADQWVKGKAWKEPQVGLASSTAALSLEVEPAYVANATGSVEEPGYGYDPNSCSPFRTVFEQNNATVIPSSGHLEVTETDLSLPGRNGLDFQLTRTYYSSSAALQIARQGHPKDPVTGEVIVVNITDPVTEVDGIGMGWSWEIPRVCEVGSIVQFSLGRGRVYTFADGKLPLKDYTFERVTNPRGYRVKHNAGINYLFDSQGRLTEKRNRYGDTITYVWNADNRLARVVDSAKRNIVFNYTPDAVTVTVESGSNPYQIKYCKRKRPETYLQGQAELYKVEFPENAAVQYEYKIQGARFDFAYDYLPKTVYYMNLVAKTNPYGGKTCYGYEIHTRPRYDSGYQEYYKIAYTYDLNDAKQQNYTRFTYQNHDVKEQNYYTTILHYGHSANTGWSKKEYLTFNKNRENIEAVTEIADQPGYKETKKTAYYRGLPEYITVTGSKSSAASETLVTDYDYDEYGNTLSVTERIGQRTGHYTESGFSQKTFTRDNMNINLQVTDWTRTRVGTEEGWNFVENRNEYDGNGNVKKAITQEYTANRQAVTENILASPVTLSLKSLSHFVHLPAGSSRVVVNFTSTGGEGIRVKCWEEGQAYPDDRSSLPPVSSSPYTLNLDPAREYIMEMTIGNDDDPLTQNSFLVLSNVNVTYNKLVLTAGAVKSTAHSHYASMNTLGLPDVVHVEYGNGGAVHNEAFGADSCIVTRYEYQAAVDNPAANENYANMFPSKIIQEYRDADEKANQEITGLRYNRSGQITQIKKWGSTSAEVLTSTFTYDGLNRLTSEVYQSSASPNKYLKKTYSYSATPDAYGLFYTLIRHQDEAGNGMYNHETRFYYDKLGQYVKTTKGYTSRITVEKVTYDSYGRKESVEDGSGVKTTFAYDGYGREKRISSIDKTGAEKVSRENVYDDLARTVTENIYELNGAAKTLKGKTVQHYNPYGQLIRTDQYLWAAGSTHYDTKYTYDLQNQVVSVTGPRKNSVTNDDLTLKYEYDYFGVKKVDYPGSVRNDDIYINNYLDRTKEVRKETAANSYIVTAYDELDRVKKITYPAPDGRTVKYYYDGAGRVVRTTEGTSAVDSRIGYEYDLTGNVKKATHTYVGYTFTVEYGYDEKGNITGIAYPTGNPSEAAYMVNYEYDPYGRVINVPKFVMGGVINPPKPDPRDPIIGDPDPIDVTAMSASLSALAPGVKYRDNGFMEEIRYVNGVTTVFTDDSLGRIRTIKNPVLELTYGYDGKGNVTSITGTNGVALSSTYTYYDNDWLKDARQGQKVYGYSYDAAGNCTTKTINGIATSYAYAPDSLNILTSISGKTIEHDKWGNMTGRNDTVCGYTYNLSNQLTRVMKSGQEVGRYFYNSEGKRYKKVENGKSTYYVYSGEVLLYELTPADGKAVHYIYLQGKQIAKVERTNGVEKKFFYHTDHLGSTRAITDESGKVVGRFEYQPFGAEESATGDDTLTFTGKMQDDPTGLMYFNARYYDPNLGRFITEDCVRDGQNWYNYCDNNPLNYFDPTGLARQSQRRSLIDDFKSDKAGRIILWHYLTGGGKELNIRNDSYWSNYMMDNDIIKFNVRMVLLKEAEKFKNGTSGEVNITMSMILENGESIIGYQYLHGTHKSEGGFQIKGTISKDKNGVTTYQMSYQWNDIIDPNFAWKSDTIKSTAAELLTIGHAEEYVIRITWSDTSIYDPKGGSSGWLFTPY